MTSAVGNAAVQTSVFSSRKEKTHTLEFFRATYINACSENAVNFYVLFSVCFLSNLTLSVDMTLHLCLEKMNNMILVRNV